MSQIELLRIFEDSRDHVLPSALAVIVVYDVTCDVITTNSQSGREDKRVTVRDELPSGRREEMY